MHEERAMIGCLFCIERERKISELQNRVKCLEEMLANLHRSRGVRNTDPSTSAEARPLVLRAASQRSAYLREYIRQWKADPIENRGMSSAEAAEALGKDHFGPSSWKRVSELWQAGLLDWSGEKRINKASGAKQRVYHLTPLGLRYESDITPAT